jgi:hypothetical protein
MFFLHRSAPSLLLFVSFSQGREAPAAHLNNKSKVILTATVFRSIHSAIVLGWETQAPTSLTTTDVFLTKPKHPNSCANHSCRQQRARYRRGLA